ncbi:hypothetical protein D4S03_06420 [bacterium]|nr:MAG: hypothetical protein D4S03_06420 [bacterium]
MQNRIMNDERLKIEAKGSNVTGQRDTTSGQMEQRINEIKVHGLAARGRKELIRYLEERPLQRGQAISAKCYDCMGYYADGKLDCLILACPLHGFMPYRGQGGD